MAQTRKKTSKSSAAKRISQRTQVTLIIAAASLVVIVGGWWGYFALTTAPPPELETATTDDVAEFLGNSRGFARMSVPQAEAFLGRTYERFNTYEGRSNLIRSFRRLPQSQQQICVDKTFDVAREITLRSAEEYRRLPKKEKSKYVDKTLKRFRAMQGELSGRGDPNVDFGQAVMPHMPTSSRDMRKLLVTRTTPSQRARAEPFINAIAQRREEQKTRRRQN